MLAVISNQLLPLSEWAFFGMLSIAALWAIDEYCFEILRGFHNRRAKDEFSGTSDYCAATGEDATPTMQEVVDDNVALVLCAWRDVEALTFTVDKLVASCTEDQAIFLGTWAEDIATNMEAQRLSCQYPHVHHCELSSRRLGSEAAGFNDIVAFVRVYEDDTGDEFGGYVFVTPGDSLHPAAIDLVRHELARHDVLRLPTLAASRATTGFLETLQNSGHIEFYRREMSIRAAFGSVGGPGLAIALSRRAMNSVPGTLLRPASRTPFYDLVQRLRQGNIATLSAPVAELGEGEHQADGKIIGITRPQPSSLKAIVRARSDGLIGVFEAWRCYGWRGSRPARYALWRDRRELILGTFFVITSSIAIFSYALANAFGVDQRLSVVSSQQHLLSTIAAIVVFGVGLKFFNRYRLTQSFAMNVSAAAVAKQLLAELVILFMVLGKAGAAGIRGLVIGRARYVEERSVLPRQGLAQTVESDPTLAREHRPIGELLIDWGVLSPIERDSALLEQQQSNHQLGRILIDRGKVSERTVLQAVSHQICVETIEIDADKVPARLGTLLSLRSLSKHRVFPIRISDNDEIVLACYRLPQPDAVLALRAELGRPIRLCLAKRATIRKTLRMYTELSRSMDRRFIAASYESVASLFDRVRLQAALDRRRQPPTSNRRLLGDALVGAGVIDDHCLRMCQLNAAGKDLSLRDYLVNYGVVPAETVDRIAERSARVGGLRLATIDGCTLPSHAKLALESVGSEVR